MQVGRHYWIKQTTRIVAGEIAEFRHGVDVNSLDKRPITQLALNEVGHVVLSLNQPIAYDPYKVNSATGAFIVIDRVTNTTVGAGMILEQDRRGSSASDGGGAHLRVRHGEVTLQQREERFAQKAVTILLTGLTGSGKASIAYALDHRSGALDHSMQYARGLDRGTADKFVGMYVNQWTLDYGATGREAVQVLLDRGHEAGIIRQPVVVEFAE